MFKKITYTPSEDFETLKNITFEFEEYTAYLGYVLREKWVIISLIVTLSDSKQITFTDAISVSHDPQREKQYKELGVKFLENALHNHVSESLEIYMACNKPES